MGTTYQYQCLDELDAIRLIRLQPSPSLTETVQCTMVHTTLSACDIDMIDHYTALSYVWGDPLDAVTISVDGKDLEVTATLNSALRYMRDERRSRLIWADAICINQSDDEEKAKQVNQMAAVYKGAQHTIIYLGEPTPYSEFLLRFLTRKGHSANNGTINMLHFHDVLGRPWFTRVWIFQELLFSADPWMQCGCERVRWNVFLGACKGQVQFQRLRLNYYRVIFDMENARNNLGSKNLDVELESTEFVELLLTTLQKRRSFKAHDPRDMLFAHIGIIGIPRDEFFGHAGHRSPIAVDYTKTLKKVYEDVTNYVFSRGCHFLSYAENLVALDERSDHVASWCPDWRYKSPAQSLSKHFDNVYHDASYDIPAPASLMEQTLRFPWRRVIHRSIILYPSIFACIGFKLGCLDSVSHVIGPADDLYYRGPLSMIWPSNKQGILQAFESVLKSMNFPRTERFLEMLHRGDQDVVDLQTENLRSSQYFLGQFFLDYLQASHVGTDYIPFLFNRRLGSVKDVTEGGKLDVLGVVPAAARPGDVVCFLQDHKVPVILRPYDVAIEGKTVDGAHVKMSPWFRRSPEISTGHFQFVGECFVEENMFGLAETKYHLGYYSDLQIIALH